jgi:acyl transferase domain-containing protein
VSEVFDFRGPSFAVDTAGSSALVALHEAVGHLRSGQVEAAVVGGVYVQLDPIMMVCFSRIGALSRTNRCRPFSDQTDGVVMGGGVGVVILKRLTDAVRDEDQIAAVIAGTAVNNDGRGGGPFTPPLRGHLEVLEAAWRDAGKDPADVDYVEAHGTATPVGDRVELDAF